MSNTRDLGTLEYGGARFGDSVDISDGTEGEKIGVTGAEGPLADELALVGVTGESSEVLEGFTELSEATEPTDIDEGPRKACPKFGIGNVGAIEVAEADPPAV